MSETNGISPAPLEGTVVRKGSPDRAHEAAQWIAEQGMVSRGEIHPGTLRPVIPGEIVADTSPEESDPTKPVWDAEALGKPPTPVEPERPEVDPTQPVWDRDALVPPDAQK